MKKPGSKTLAFDFDSIFRGLGVGFDGSRNGFAGQFFEMARFADVPHDAKDIKELDDVIRNIKFPPVDSLASGDLVVVVIIVPAFTQRNHGDKGVVAAGVRRVESAFAE